MPQLQERHCRNASEQALTPAQLSEQLKALPQWRSEGAAIVRDWKFADHYKAAAFVNAVVWISHGQDHHPDIHLGYNSVQVSYSTHSSGGVTEKDLICAARVSALEA